MEAYLGRNEDTGLSSSANCLSLFLNFRHKKSLNLSIQAFVVVGKEKERTAIYKPQPAPPDVTGRLSFYKESNQLNYHSAQSVRYFIAEFQVQKKPESFDSGFRCCWRSGRDSNPRPPA